MAVAFQFLPAINPVNWWRQHLTTRLSGYFLLLSLASVGITGGATFYRAQTSLQQSAFDQLGVAAALKENEINRWFEDQQRIFLSVAQLPIVQSQSRVLLASETRLTEQKKARALLVKYLASLDPSQSQFTEVAILDRGDRTLISTNPTKQGEYASSADLTYFEEVKPGKPTTPIFYTASGSSLSSHLITTFATPLRGSKGERIGVLVAHLNLERLSHIVKAQADLGQSVDAYLVGRVDGNQALVSKPLNNNPLGQTVSSPGIDAAMRGLHGRDLYHNYAQVPVIGAYRSLSEIGLALMVEQRQDIADVPAQQLARQIMLVGLAMAGAISLALYGVVRRIVRPVLEIAHTATRVAEGDLEQCAPVLTDDEVGLLARQFNYMVNQLRLSREQSEGYSRSLEQKAEELETALQEINSAQAQLVQSEKMSSLGQLVAGVAHEINNPVNFIHGNLDYLQDYAQDLIKLVQVYQQSCPSISPELQETIDDIDFDFLVEDIAKILASMKVGTDRIREIVLSLRNFSRVDESEFKSVDIHEGIDSTLMILQHRLKATAKRPEIQILKQYAPLPLVECCPGQLNQVLMNLLVNGIDALEQAHQDRSAEERLAQPPTIWIQTQLSKPGSIRLTIADNGLGMSETVQARLFDPFFTTKPVGKGTGLGLSISYQIVTKKHHGKIWCDSTPGKGTKFVIQVPIIQPS